MVPNADTTILAETVSKNGVQPAVWIHTYGKGKICYRFYSKRTLFGMSDKVFVLVHDYWHHDDSIKPMMNYLFNADYEVSDAWSIIVPIPFWISFRNFSVHFSSHQIGVGIWSFSTGSLICFCLSKILLKMIRFLLNLVWWKMDGEISEWCSEWYGNDYVSRITYW